MIKKILETLLRRMKKSMGNKSDKLEETITKAAKEIEKLVDEYFNENEIVKIEKVKEEYAYDIHYESIKFI